jgi:uncharacterized membrane protein (DUF4010 family)
VLGIVYRTISAHVLKKAGNLAFKGGLVALLGSREQLRHVVALFGAALVVGGAILWLWPT